MTERTEIEAAAKDGQPWSLEFQRQIEELRRITNKTPEELRAFRILLQREINEAVRRRKAIEEVGYYNEGFHGPLDTLE